jgi:hypothetical protein
MFDYGSVPGCYQSDYIQRCCTELSIQGIWKYNRLLISKETLIFTDHPNGFLAQSINAFVIDMKPSFRRATVIRK